MCVCQCEACVLVGSKSATATYSDRTLKEAKPPFGKDFKKRTSIWYNTLLTNSTRNLHQSCSEHDSLSVVFYGLQLMSKLRRISTTNSSVLVATTVLDDQRTKLRHSER